MCFLWQHEIHLIFTRYFMPLLGASSCRPSVSPEPSTGRMPLLVLWLHPQDTAVGRGRTQCSFSSKRALVYCFSSNMRSELVYGVLFLCLFVFLFDSYHFSRALVRYVHTRRTLYKAKQGCSVASCTTFSYWGAC